MSDDILDWGASFLSEIAKDYATQDVIISWKDVTIRSVPLKASLVDEEGRILRGEVKARQEYTFFMFNTNDLENNSIPLEPGMSIQWNESFYELVTLGGKCYFFNDTHRYNTVVVTKHVSD